MSDALQDTLHKKLDTVASIAGSTKLQRFLRDPVKYFNAVVLREISYKRTQAEKSVQSTTFFGADMQLLLPSGTDIYLTGGKSHDSEVRLARLLVEVLKAGDSFVDVGAHYGYFTLLASTLVEAGGRVVCIEAAPRTYEVLQQNVAPIANISAYNAAISDREIELKFYEFPNLYSEYNTTDVDQFRNESWFARYPPKESIVKGLTLDSFLEKNNVRPSLIKIDVEGAEHQVIGGAVKHLQQFKPMIVMEYLSSNRGNRPHVQAAQSLLALGYEQYCIDAKGGLSAVENVEHHLRAQQLDSDNIVFVAQQQG